MLTPSIGAPTATIVVDDSLIRDRHVLIEEALGLSLILIQTAYFYPDDGSTDSGDQLIPVTFTRRGLIRTATMLQQLARSDREPSS